MSKSIISNEYECFICKTNRYLQRHHIFYGTANRAISEEWGCWVWLCSRHHNGSNAGVHLNRNLDMRLKVMCQEEWERRFGGREAFIKTFGRSWI